MIGVRGPLTPERVALANANLGLIDAVLRVHPYWSEDRDDAWQDGYFGLLRATADWDPTRGRFSTYAFVWIRSAIGHGLRRFEGTSFLYEEWHHPERLDAPIGDDADVTFGDLLPERLPDQDDGLTAEVRERVQVIHDACRDDLDRAIVRNLSHGVGAVQAAAEFGVCRDLPAKRVMRMRKRIERMEQAS